MDNSKNLSFKEKASFAWSYLKQSQKQVYVYTLVVLLASLLGSLYPYLTGRIIDISSGNGGFGGFTWWQLAAIVAAVMFGGTMVREFMDFLINILETRITSKVSLDLLRHIYQLRFVDLQGKSQGELLKIMDRMSGSINRMIEMIIYNFLNQLVTLVIALIVIAIFSWPLAVMLLASVILFFFFSICYKMPEILKKQKKINDTYNEQSMNITDSIINISTVKSFMSAGQELKVKKAKWREIINQVKDIAKLYINYGLAQSLINNAMRLVTILYTIYSFRQGKISFGELTAIISYVNWAMGPLFMLANNIREFRRHLVNLEDAANIKQLELETDDDNAEAHTIKGKVVFRNVNFAYPGRDHLTLKDINLVLEPGQTLALVGQTGSGKSTLGKLLKRMFALKSGDILIDGIEIKKIKLSSLRPQIVIVEQNPQLFTGTIKDNIAYGRFDATFEEVRHAALVAQLDEEMMSDAFPEHYDTKVSSDGSGLSGGQIQRIAIARAIINKPKILVLDEATNSLDLLTKHMILESLQEYIHGLTTVIISHDLSAMVRQADQIVVMHDGQIVQQGKHEELLTQPGVYSQYWEIQKTI